MVTPTQQSWIDFKARYGKKIYHSNVPNSMKIGRYTHDFPMRLELQQGTKTAVMNACRKYLGRSYLSLVNYRIVVHKEGTWIYHNGILYLKNPADESIVTMAMLAK